MSEEFESATGAVASNGTRYMVRYMKPGEYELYRAELDREGREIWWGCGTLRPESDTEKGIEKAIAVKEGFFDPDDF
jgi:hypothetical protein